MDNHRIMKQSIGDQCQADEEDEKKSLVIARKWLLQYRKFSESLGFL